jgi:hypothetical protein
VSFFTFNVTGTDTNGCKATHAVVVRVNSCAGIDEKAPAAVRVFPNPNHGRFTVMADLPLTLRLINQLGQQVRMILLGHDNGFQADVSELAAGVYFLEWQHEGRRQSSRIVITDK